MQLYPLHAMPKPYLLLVVHHPAREVPQTATPGSAGRCWAVWVTTRTQGVYFPFFLTVSTTVVFGWRLAWLFLTKRPDLALRATLTVLLGMGLGGACAGTDGPSVPDARLSLEKISAARTEVVGAPDADAAPVAQPVRHLIVEVTTR